MNVPSKSPARPIEVAFLPANGFEQIELTGPRKAFIIAGFRTTIVSPKSREVKAMVRAQKRSVP
jgi:putative intracellular protease/amidase